MLIPRMAWRNIWRNSRRTGATVAAMSLALLIMILYAGLMEGYLQGAENNILNLELGDVQIHHQDYLRKPSIYRTIADPDAVLARLDASGYTASGRLLGSGLVASGENSSGAVMRGVDVERDAHIGDIQKHVDRGEWLTATDDRSVVIGSRLARTLNIDVGGELLVLSQAADGSVANALYTVRGVLKGIGDVVDRSGVYMTEAAFRELMVMPTGVHQIIVRRGEVPLAQARSAVVAAAPDLEVKTWRELIPTLASMLDSSRAITTTVFLIVYLAIGIVILNAMLMAVFERIKEFGVLKAVGLAPSTIAGLIGFETAILASMSVVIGTLASIPCVIYLTTTGIDLQSMGGVSIMGVAWDPIWRAHVTSETYSGPIVTMLIIVALSVIYPMIKAATISPVAAMRHH